MSEQSGSPARHQRSTSGLIGSLIVTVSAVVVVGFLLQADNGASRRSPDPVDYTEVVDAAREAGYRVAHPATLPDGWVATSVDFVPATPADWSVGLLTSTDTFAGVRQEDADLADLLKTYVDEEVVQGDDVTIDSPLGATWASYSDNGGDTAYAATVAIDGESATVLVYGSASGADLRRLLGSLTLD